jgi:predicted dinucleotide-binding enzyme
MDIGIIGSGHVGSTLARHPTALGRQVSIANSRGPASLATVAADTGAAAATVEQAARAKYLVVIAVPEKSVRQLPRSSFAVTSAVVVDAGTHPERSLSSKLALAPPE